MSETLHNSGHDSATPDSAVPVPPRYWWLKRIGVASGVLLLLLVAMRLYWGYEANHRLQAEIDRIRAAGQPIYPEDFDPPEVPDDDNAALALQRAVAAITDAPGVNLGIDDVLFSLTDLGIFTERPDDVAAFMAANQPVFDLVRASRSMNGVDWGVRLRSPIINSYTAASPLHSAQRTLAKFIYIKSLYDLEVGNHAGGVESTRDIVHIANTFARMRFFLVTYLVSVSIHDLATMVVERELPRLLAAEGGTISSASRDAAARLIVDLLDEQSLRDALRVAYRAEMSQCIDSAGGFPGSRFDAYDYVLWPVSLPPFWAAVAKALFKPMAQMEALRRLPCYAAAADAAHVANFPVAMRTLPKPPTHPAEILDTARMLERWALENRLPRIMQIHFRYIAKRRMAAIALAIRMYELDQGRRPDALSELVPDYLSNVPLDPFAEDGHVIRYKPAAPRPLLYSVHLDGRDDGGTPTQRKARQDARFEIQVEQVGDFRFFLDGQKPESARGAVILQGSTGQADEEQRDVEDRGGEAQQDEAGDAKPQGGQPESEGPDAPTTGL
jgi:hypothetical protein